MAWEKEVALTWVLAKILGKLPELPDPQRMLGNQEPLCRVTYSLAQHTALNSVPGVQWLALRLQRTRRSPWTGRGFQGFFWSPT